MSLLTQFFRNTLAGPTAVLAENNIVNSASYDDDNAITAFNCCDYPRALELFSAMEKTKYSVTMMIKCNYRMGHWDTAIMLYNDNHLVLGSLCNEMIYIEARCLYEAGLQLDRNTPVRINYFNLGLDLVTRIASSRQNANVKFDLLIPQINMAMGNHMAAYESATVLLTRSTLSSSKYAELLMLRARASRMIGDSAAAMNDYYTAIEAANYTNNWALLGVLHADIIGYSRNNQLEYSNDVSMHVASEFTAAGHLAAVNHKVLANHYFRITNVNNNRDLETSRYTLLSVNNSRRFAENVNITAQ